ncbi:splicing factor 3A subunit 2-like isoform X2 [Pongo abelii]|uniref:splicing factor 3A subunit 2-like isoform X2 n=1 Tax=Pongo abelii TaxID=9601 RepID=UPI0023E86ED9|nr:splicing factor 3A subunit 2-like isoform X3 [Pongo abelii]
MAPPSPMDRCPRLRILSVLFLKRPRHMLKHVRIRSQPSGTARSQEHPGPRKAPSPACPTRSGAEVLGHPWQPRHTPQGQGHRQQGLPRPARLLPAATATNAAPGVPRALAASPGLHGDAPGLRVPSPRCRQEASYAPPPQQAGSIKVHKQQMNKS